MTKPTGKPRGRPRKTDNPDVIRQTITAQLDKIGQEIGQTQPAAPIVSPSIPITEAPAAQAPAAAQVLTPEIVPEAGPAAEKRVTQADKAAKRGQVVEGQGDKLGVPPDSELQRALHDREGKLVEVLRATFDRLPTTRTRATPEQLAEWLCMVADGAFERDACKEIGLEMPCIQGLAARIPAFLALKHLAHDMSVQARAQRVERAAFKRAVIGTKRPVFQGGVEVGHVREFSDKLAQMFLEADQPERFKRGPTPVQINNSNAMLVRWDFGGLDA